LNKRKTNLPDTKALTDTVNAGTARQNEIASALPGKLAPLSGQYQGNLENAVNTARSGLTAEGDKLVSGVGDTSSEMFQKESAQLKQNALDASTAAARLQRNNLAAGGNLNSGAGVSAARNLAVETAKNITQGQTALGVQSLAAKQQALQSVYQQNAELVHNTLGINADEFKTLLSSGRQDLIDEATNLLNISQNDTNSKLQIGQIGQNRQIASELGNAQGRNDLNSSIVQALGYGLASRGQTNG